ncbi:hypothetical protein A0H81_07063 [Grifola frondosa]|uniref:Uncharacterized protein n=1 Tax=Grifola frondosa TaxID=5627 RepID=A0A1C7M7D2_GRIFR|nr:hypothetical protein A0H81_07063 [Grifola frondosa]
MQYKCQVRVPICNHILLNYHKKTDSLPSWSAVRVPRSLIRGAQSRGNIKTTAAKPGTFGTTIGVQRIISVDNTCMMEPTPCSLRLRHHAWVNSTS